MTSAQAAALSAALGPMVVLGESLAPFTTYRLGGPAAAVARPTSADDLRRLGDALREHPLPILVIGRGSNLLISDGGFNGLAVLTSGLGDHVRFAGNEMRCDANVLLPVAARRSAAHGLTGFEWAVGVPGSVGGGVRMNAGGHGSDVATSLTRVVVCDLGSGATGELASERLGLRFRGSDLADHQLVVEATFVLAPGDCAVAEGEIAEIVRWRREHQPGGQNAGSVFVNPVPGQVTAGELIDRVGLRGLRHGGAFVSEKHANFIQAGPGASADDVRELIRLVRERVADETGYMMRSEVRQVGFADADATGHTDNVGVPL